MDEEKWENRFTNLWLAGERDEELVHSIEPITKPSVEIETAEAREVSVEKTQTEVSLDRDEWLEKFAHLWLTEKKARLPTQPEKNMEGKDRVNLPDLQTMDVAPGPDDLIVFDIDPEIAIKLLTASKGVGS